MEYDNIVYASVFPGPTLFHTTPTPIATPEVGYTPPGQTFGGPFGTDIHRPRAVQRNLAWSTATRFLSLPTTPQARPEKRIKTSEVENALEYLLVGEGRKTDENETELFEWYISEARVHFLQCYRPALWEHCQPPFQAPWDFLETILKIIEDAQDQCLQPFIDHILPILSGTSFSSSVTITADSRSDAELQYTKLRRELHALFAYSIPKPMSFFRLLSVVLYDAACKMFRIHFRRGKVVRDAGQENTKAVHVRMMKLLQGLQGVGLGGDSAQRAFANAMDRLIDSFIETHFVRADWYTNKPVVDQLYMWVNNGLAGLQDLVMECLGCGPSVDHDAQLHRWREMALQRLGHARVENLFNFVLNWDESLGAILDIKEYLKTDGAKQYVAGKFSEQLSSNILHAGASTTHILNMYISVIRVFHELEPKGVLLERVARPIRRCLRERSDTARIIISSLLADLDEEDDAPDSDLSYEITKEMEKPIANINRDIDEEFDWNDLNWQPLPNDASPDYKKSKVEDVIWFLLTLWDREDFITEMKTIFGEHLLQAQDPEYEKEIRLLELIKIRLGDDKLQPCEVMLRDILDSKRINAIIHPKDSSLLETPSCAPRTPEVASKGPRTPRTPQARPQTRSSTKLQTPVLIPSKSKPVEFLTAQIISSNFWPTLHEDTFKVPAVVEAAQNEYASEYEAIRSMRKLDWMPALGDTNVILELEDRSVELKVKTWQATVIYAFQPQPGEEWTAGKHKGKGKPKAEPITRNVEQLEEMLEMDEDLVRQALTFWVSQSILRETHPDTYAVIENLAALQADAEEVAAAQERAKQQAALQATAVKSQQDVLNEKKALYSQFVVGMLTNQGNMPVQRMLMMLKMVVPGGFPFGADELKGLLAGMVEEGRLVEMGSGMFGIKK